MKRQPERFSGILGLIVIAVATIAGCGFNTQQQLANAFAAAGQAALDQFLTDVANGVADARDQQAANVNDNAPAANTNDNEAPTDSGGGDDPVARGQTLVADNCSACHGADGASGFAPDIQGAAAATIGEFTSGGNGHVVVDLSEEDTTDVEAYLASFAGDGGAGSGLAGDATAGEALLDQNCSICHGVDGASGFAPNIQGVDEALIMARPGTGGNGHTLIDLTEQDIADIAAFLGSF